MVNATGWQTHSSLGKQVKDFYQATHLGALKTAELLSPRYYVLNFDSMTENNIFRCSICAQVNQPQWPR